MGTGYQEQGYESLPHSQSTTECTHVKERTTLVLLSLVGHIYSMLKVSNMGTVSCLSFRNLLSPLHLKFG